MHPGRTARLFAPFITPRQNLLNRCAAGMLSHFLDLSHRTTRVGSPAFFIGNEAGDGLTVPRDYDGLAALDLVEQLGKPRLGRRCLNFLHLF
jgi:hypothetical protein